MGNDLTANSAETGDLPPRLEWPKLDWRLELRLGIASLLLGIAALFVPLPVQYSNLTALRNIAVLAIVLLLLLAPLVDWAIQTGRTLIARADEYAVLYRHAIVLHEANERLRADLFQVLQGNEKHAELEIRQAVYLNKELYISVASTISLQEGSLLRVLDKKDGKIMGTFKITEQRSTEYYAIETSTIDPLWKGFVVEHSPLMMFPNLVAVYVPQGETS